MKLRWISFSERGTELAERLAGELGGTADRKVSLKDWTAAHFADADALVFVGAAGIAVRAIAPYVEKKTTDPAVVVVDELGRFAIPILSGHLGGANDLARRIAAACGAEPVITTATDLNGKFAVDEWAKRQNCALIEPERIVKVSGCVLAGKTVAVSSDWPVEGDCPDGVRIGANGMVRVSLIDDGTEALHLVPRIGVLGIGCKKDTPMEVIEAVLADFLRENRIFGSCIVSAASIDVKKNEPGLLAFCRRHGFDFETWPAEELNAVEGTFTASEFVASRVGVDNVCERSAVRASGGTLVVRKYAKNGVTMALAQKEYALTWRWQFG